MTKFFKRISNLWSMSSQYVVPQTETTRVIKKPIKEKYPAKFIPYKKKTPAQEIAEQAHENN